MLVFRRLLVLQLLMLWQGGFVFYALVVVPIGTDVLGSATEQGFITRRVAPWLNGFGIACLVALVVDIQRIDSLAMIRRFFAWLTVMALIALYFVYARLDERLDPALRVVKDPAGFYRWHAVYLTVSGVQWLLMLFNVFLMLIAWRDVDARIHQTRIMDEP